jgi:hypothetical protein
VESYPSLFDQPKSSLRKKPEVGAASTPAEEMADTVVSDSPRPADDAAPPA